MKRPNLMVRMLRGEVTSDHYLAVVDRWMRIYWPKVKK